MSGSPLSNTSYVQYKSKGFYSWRTDGGTRYERVSKVGNKSVKKDYIKSDY